MMGKAAIILIGVYRMLVSPILPNACRFQPTCSEYASEAISELGFLKGSWLAFKRILRCNPYCEGGYDPVPTGRSCCGNNSEKITSPEVNG